VDQEQDWIAKYRAALDTNPRKPSPLEKILGFLRTSRTKIVQIFTSQKKVSLARGPGFETSATLGPRKEAGSDKAAPIDGVKADKAS
jgi:hypothetical protein